MGKKKDKARAEAEAAASAAAAPAKPKRLRVPLFTASWAREHLAEHHGITTAADTAPTLLASIHQADHVAAGLGGRPIVVPHVHTADIKRED